MMRTLLLVTVFLVCIAQTLVAQTAPASISWPLNATSALTSTASGQVSGYDETTSLLTLGSPGYTGPNQSQRWKMGTTYPGQAGAGWPANQTTEMPDVYSQYAVSVNDGYSFTIDSVALSIAGLSSAVMKANVYYSKDASFATRTQIPYTTGLTSGASTEVLPSSTTTNLMIRVKAISINITINPGEKFYVRVYPWLDQGALSSSKYICFKNVIIGGFTTSTGLKSAIIWPYETNEEPVVTGGLLAQKPSVGTNLIYETIASSAGVTAGTYKPAMDWQALTAIDVNTYIQYALQPKYGGNFTGDKLSVYLGAANSTSLKAAVYFSKDINFATKTLAIADVVLSNNALTKLSAPFTEALANQEMIYFRIYPYNTVAEASSKSILVDSLSISGMIMGMVADQPTVISVATASNISVTYAQAGGTVSSDGGMAVTARGIVYNTTGAPTVNDIKTVDGSGSGVFVSIPRNLSANTKYYWRAYATNPAGTSYGAENSFTTLAEITAPTLTTNEITNILVKTAQSGGIITTWGGDTITVKGICWNTTGSPTTTDAKTTDGSGIEKFTSAMTNLSQTTTYFVRAYATSKLGGTGYGPEISFTTQAPKPDVTKTVAKDGTGDYTTVQAAFNAVEDNYTGKWTILIKPGKYYEKLLLAPTKVNVILRGENPDSTVLWYDDSTDSLAVGTTTKLGTSGSYSVRIDPNEFAAYNITFQNTNKVAQSVALLTQGDKQSFFNCRILGYQDTYYSYSLGRVYMKYCYIEGSVDFIFGQSTVLFDSCQLNCNRSGGVLTAPNTPLASKFGYVFRNCKITTETIGFDGAAITGFYLGRPWQNNPKSVFIQCDEPANLSSTGWTVMTTGLNPFFAEYKCTGTGFKPTTRSSHADYTGVQLSDEAALNYTMANIFAKTTNPSFAGDWVPEFASVKLNQINFSSLVDKKYSDISFDLTATTSSNLPIKYKSSNAKIAAVDGNKILIKSVGTVTIRATQAGNNLFVSAPDQTQTLNITKATLEVKAKNESRMKGLANPVFTIEYLGFVGTDNVDSINTKPTTACLADASSLIGDYDIDVSGGSDNNYEIVPSASKGKLTITFNTGINAELDAKIKIYPNPVQDKIQIELPSQFVSTKMKILNMEGREILQKTISGSNNEVDFTKLPLGVYFIQIQSKEGVLTKQIIKQ